MWRANYVHFLYGIGPFLARFVPEIIQNDQNLPQFDQLLYFHGRKHLWHSHFLIQPKQMFHPLAFRSEAAAAVEAVYGAVKGGVGLAQVGWHQIGVVQVGQDCTGVNRSNSRLVLRWLSASHGRQHFLYLSPLPQGQRSLRPTLFVESKFLGLPREEYLRVSASISAFHSHL